MPRTRYQIAEEDIPVVHRWVDAKFRDPLWPQHNGARHARDQFPREQPTAIQLQEWCEQYLDVRQRTQLQAVIRAARRDASQTRTVRLSTRAYARLHTLAEREQLTLSATIEQYLADTTVAPSLKNAPTMAEKTPPKPPATSTAKQGAGRAAAVPRKQGTAFVTSKKGVCYLTIKIGRENFDLMKIRSYTLDAQDKRDMRRLHPDIAFDWKKIGQQLARKREVCREYRSGRQRKARDRRMPREPFYGVFEPRTRTVYVNDPTNITGVGALLDRIIADERLRGTATGMDDRYGLPEAERPSTDETGWC
jgi:macrodomain Ter protein organizer (MatP/YcbG family)